MKPSSKKIQTVFDNYETEQSDFGKIFFNTPSQSLSPKTIKELASTLKQFNAAGKAVTIRNTGHSMNGQTLTDGIQVNLGNLNRVVFHEAESLVEVEAGVPWHNLFEAIRFPEYSTGVFPSNPGQKIHVGGTAAVGGVGFLSTKYGGFWNIVEELTLVTMTGEIIKCSKTQNSDLYYYALGGYGRMGVIASLTLRVFKPKSNILEVVALIYADQSQLLRDYITNNPTERLLGEMSQMNINNPLVKSFPVNSNVISDFFEIEKEKADQIEAEVLKNNSELLHLFADFQKNHSQDLTDTHYHVRRAYTDLKSVAYYYPEDKFFPGARATNPWIDFVVRSKDYLSFVQQFIEFSKATKLSQYIMRTHTNFLNIEAEVFGTYKIRKISEELYPLSLDFEDDDFGISVMMSLQVPPEDLAEVESIITELDKLVYAFLGKRYLYGRHNLTKDQIEIQYGRETIHKWNNLKDQTDPKHLLNIGVIEHLD